MRLLTGVFSANMLVQGTVDVLIVVASIELLGLGESGVGWLNSAWGVGGLAGGLVALSLLGRGRLASGVSLGCVLAGVPLAVIGVWHVPAAAMVLLVVLGVGYAVLEAALLTLTQRLAPDDVLARVFGVQETIFVLGTAMGGLIAATLIGPLGLEVTLVVTGLVLPTLAVLLRRRLGRLEAGAAVPERLYTLLPACRSSRRCRSPRSRISPRGPRPRIIRPGPRSSARVRRATCSTWSTRARSRWLRMAACVQSWRGRMRRRDRPPAGPAPHGHGPCHDARAPGGPGSKRLPGWGVRARPQHPSR